MPHVEEKATTVREPGDEQDQFTVAVLEDETCVQLDTCCGTYPDSFYRRFLIMRHISNVASEFMLSEFLFLRYITQIIIF